jgi:hypothetical protein
MSAPVNVLVVFYSRYGRAERLALAAGVGAIEAEGNIRLRRLPDLATEEAIQADAAWREALERMSRDYVAPRPADPLWADVIVLATPVESAREIEAYVATLPALGPMAGKLAAPLAPGCGGSCDAVVVAAARAGLMTVPLALDGVSDRGDAGAQGDDDPVTRARLHGQRLVQLARALKPSG